MKRTTVLILCTLVFLVSCNNNKHLSDDLYYNWDVVIVDMGTTYMHTKHPHSDKYFYVKSVKDTFLRTELTRFNFYRLTDSVYYNHSVGDTLHFDYIRKERFFRVNK